MQSTQTVKTGINHLLGNTIITMPQTLTLYQAGFTADELKGVKICITTEMEFDDYRRFINEQIWQDPPSILEINDSIQLTGQSFEGFNLSHISLHHRCLSGCDFTKTNLSHANLCHSDLSYCNFEHANMESSDLVACKLVQTNISAQQLATCHDFTSAKLGLADVIKLMSDSTTLTDITQFRLIILTNNEMDAILSWPIVPSIDSISKEVLLNGRVFKDLDMSYLSAISTCMHSRLLQCDLDDAMLKDSDWTSTIFDECSLNRIRLENAQLVGIQLNTCRMELANLSKAILFGCKVYKSSLKHTVLDEAVLYQAHIEDSDLSMTSFHSADLTETTFKNVILWEAWLINTKIQPTQLQRTQCEGAVVDVATIQTWGDATQAHQLGLCVVISHLAEWQYYLQLADKPRIQMIDARIVDQCHRDLDVNAPVELGIYQWLMNQNPSLATTYQLHIPETALRKLRILCYEMESGGWVDVISQNKLQDFERLMLQPQFVLGIPHLNWGAGMVYEATGIKNWLVENQRDPQRQPLIMQDCIPLRGVLWSLHQQHPTEFNSESYPRLFKLVIGGDI